MNTKIRIFSLFLLLSGLLVTAGAYAGQVVQVQLTDTATQSYECTVEGKVIKVTDGDTIEVLDSDNTKHKIRLAGIDAPEKKQAFGNAARKHLADLVASKEVCVSSHKKDKYRRLVGTVIVDGESANFRMLKDGYAWHFKKYAKEQPELERKVFAETELQARSDTVGLWSEPEPIAPWDWRDGIHHSAQKAAALDGTADEDCGMKRFCRQMVSCSEACHYLQDCHIGKLDKDGDGRPCETLCSQSCGG